LFGFLIIRHVGESTHSCLKDTRADFPVDPGGELPRLVTDAFDFSNSLGVGGPQSFSTSIVCLGDRQGQADCFVRPSSQIVQIQLLSGRDVSGSGHHSRFVVADEGIARVVGVDPRWSVRTLFEVGSGGPRERGRDEGGDFLTPMATDAYPWAGECDGREHRQMLKSGTPLALRVML
jgi:hypothetical protein